VGVTETFSFLDNQRLEHQLPFLRAALVEQHPEVQIGAFRRLADPKGHNRADLIVGAFASLLPATQQLVAEKSAEFLQLASAMIHANDKNQEGAYHLVAAIGGDEAVDLLSLAVSDRSPRVREIALGGLAKHLNRFQQRCRTEPTDSHTLHKSPGWLALELVLRRYYAHRQTVFVEILVELGRSGLPLIGGLVLGGRDAHLRQALLDTLAKSAARGVGEIVLGMAMNKNDEQRRLALGILARRRDGAFGLALAAALAAVDAASAADFAGIAPAFPWLELIVPVADRIEPGVAGQVLALAGAASLNAKLRRQLGEAFLQHADAGVRVLSLQHLGATGDRDALAAVMRARTDQAPEVQMAAARAIIALDPPSKRALLTPLLGAKSEELRRLAMRDISEVAFARYLQCFDHMDEKARQIAARAVAKIDKTMLERLVDEVTSLDAGRRLKALRIVEFLDAAQDLRGPLLDLLDDPDKRVRATAIRIVELTGNVEGMKILIGALADPDRRVRANAVEAFEQVGDPRFVELLTPFLRDPDSRMRANTAKALLSLSPEVGSGNEQAQQALIDMLGDENEAMRISAAWAIGELQFAGAKELLAQRAAVELNSRVHAKVREALEAFDVEVGGSA